MAIGEVGWGWQKVLVSLPLPVRPCQPPSPAAGDHRERRTGLEGSQQVQEGGLQGRQRRQGVSGAGAAVGGGGRCGGGLPSGCSSPACSLPS